MILKKLFIATSFFILAGLSVSICGCPGKTVPSAPVTIVYVPATNTLTFTSTITPTPTITFTVTSTPTNTATWTPCVGSSVYGNNDTSGITTFAVNNKDIFSLEITIPSTTRVTDISFYGGGSPYDGTQGFNTMIFSEGVSTATPISITGNGYYGPLGWLDSNYATFNTYPVLSPGKYLLMLYATGNNLFLGMKTGTCVSYQSNYDLSTFGMGYLNPYYLNGNAGVYTTTPGTNCYEINIKTCP